MDVFFAFICTPEHDDHRGISGAVILRALFYIKNKHISVGKKNIPAVFSCCFLAFTTFLEALLL